MRKHTRVIWPRSYEYIIQYPPRWERVKGGFIGIHTTIAVIVGILAEHRWKHLVQIGQLYSNFCRHSTQSKPMFRGEIRENGMELFAAFAGLAPARGGQAVALAWKGLRPDAGCSMRFRARRGGGLSAAAAAVGTLSCCRPVPASGCRYRAAAGDVVSAACGRGSGRVDVVV
jgi:hypothetical protein